jgi:hypothetical protein
MGRWIAKYPMSIKEGSMEYVLGFCEECYQMTNHLEGICQKCKKECPVCGSPVIDGHCQDYGSNNCMWTEE